MPRFEELQPALPTVEWFLGWIACLRLAATRRNAIHPGTLLRLEQHLRRFGFTVLPEAPPSFGLQVQCLWALVIAPLKRLQNIPRYYDGGAPTPERRVHVRHVGFYSWQCFRGARVDAHQVCGNVFPHSSFDRALPLLRAHGRAFERTQHVTRSDQFNVEVTSLHCVLLDFEVVLRMTIREEVDYDSSAWSSDS